MSLPSLSLVAHGGERSDGAAKLGRVSRALALIARFTGTGRPRGAGAALNIARHGSASGAASSAALVVVQHRAENQPCGAEIDVISQSATSDRIAMRRAHAAPALALSLDNRSCGLRALAAAAGGVAAYM
jgi:hypothetical protein